MLSRVSTRLATAMAGAGLGWWIGARIGHPAPAALLGAAVAVLSLSVLDTLKGHQLLDWLRTPEAEAPKLPGLWGEVAHRIQRVLRQRDLLLADERRRLDQLLSGIQASPNGVLLLNDSDHITWISKVAADHFGLDPNRDLMQRVTNLIRQPAFVQYMQAGDFREPVKCPMPRGGHGYLSVQASRYGEGLKLILSQDITERERADTMRRDFVANVSHEIRTPLTVLSGFIETLASLPLTEAERQRVITLMGQQAERMQGLVADLLTLAQIEGSPRPTSDRWIKVGDLMQRLENDGLGLSCGRHSMTFAVDDLGGKTEIAGVESEWLSAMGNLVSNAVRYTPDGASIDVRWVTMPEGGAEFSVRDGGIGIAPEHIPRLTERFYRVDGSRSRETGGTGLGLSIVKHVVQRHGGELRIASVPGKGSTFTLSVPAARVRVV
ncbi:MAG: phosphate regulon sensor histidine kinase PhoR [Burkholderiales bacterium]|nr:phosphate regulon sensor histidine kinase PhoR [Burkholderiales bacterium]